MKLFYNSFRTLRFISKHPSVKFGYYGAIIKYLRWHIVKRFLDYPKHIIILKMLNFLDSFSKQWFILYWFGRI